MTTSQDLGDLVRDGDQWTVTFTRRLAHSIDKVWRAVTEPEHLAAWFPDTVEGTMTPGGKLRFAIEGHGEADGSFDGEVLAVEAPTLLALRWGTDELRIELTPDGDGTILTFSDTFDEVGKAARDAAGWHECLDRLVAHLEGVPAVDPQAAYAGIHRRYTDTYPPEATTVGPPEGWQD
jgi:uncharacterized protein YndB with AHSA1/START domain